MTQPRRARIAVAGAGLIGTRHAEEVHACQASELVAVVDPAPAGARLAARFGVPVHARLEELFGAGPPPDGVILATPNRVHAEGASACIAAGVPVLVEKPVADTVAGARRLVEAGERAGVPVLTGHHRQYGPTLRAARDVVASGRLGRVVAVTGTMLVHKPSGYFEAGGGWRRQRGGGSILLNFIHDVNALTCLVGDVVAVQAVASNAARGFAVEDTAAMVLTFAGGALGTFLVSDTAASPRSWEQTSGEDNRYPRHDDEDCYHLAGTRGSLSIPTMRLREYPGERSWWTPFTTTTVPVTPADPLAEQVAHFAAVIRGEAEPLVSGRDGLASLQVVEAVLEAARTGRPVAVDTGQRVDLGQEVDRMSTEVGV